jgi:hypothetical protein
MTRTLPARVGIPLQAGEAGQLLDLAGKIPMTTHSTVAKVALLLGLRQLTANPEMVETLIRAGLARRPGRGRLREITLPDLEEHTNNPHERRVSQMKLTRAAPAARVTMPKKL